MKAGLMIMIAFCIIQETFQEKETLTILSGILPDLKNEAIILIPIDEYFPGLENEGKYPSATLDSIGSFQFKFYQSRPGFYQIIRNNYHQLNRDVYLAPGDSIHVEQSSWKEDPKFLIKGKGSEKLKHLEKDFVIFPKNNDFFQNLKNSKFASEFSFQSYIDSIFDERVNALTSSSSIPEQLISYQLYSLQAERAFFLLDHLENRNYYTQGQLDYYFPEENYYAFVNSIIYNDAFSATTAAKLLAGKYLNDKARQALKNKSEEEWWEENLGWKFDFVSDQPPSKWTDLLALSTISEYSFGLMTSTFFDHKRSFEKKIDNHFSDPNYQQLYKNNILPYSQLEVGNPAPDFELPDSAGFLHRLSDYKDKIVYIDFWGTWCFPCIQEIPDALFIQDKYKDKPVVFLYVALEYDSTNIAGWQKFVAGENERFGKLLNNNPFPGVHLVAEKQFRNESIRPYKINMVPTNVLIDHQGNIYSARAKRAKDISVDIDLLLRNLEVN